MPCIHCSDPDGLPCFPQYGLAPHLHADDFSPAFKPRELWPENFKEGMENPNHGTWWCSHCDDGNPDGEIATHDHAKFTRTTPRAFVASLRDHPGVKIALLMHPMAFIAGMMKGGPDRLFYAMLGAAAMSIFWIPVLWTAWAMRDQYRINKNADYYTKPR